MKDDREKRGNIKRTEKEGARMSNTLCLHGVRDKVKKERSSHNWMLYILSAS